MKYNNLDIYQAKIENECDGIFTISIVDYPAVERDFVCFKKESKPLMFSINNEEKQNITGVVMIADTPIYRRNGDYEYYITYSKSTIELMANKLLKDGLQNQISLQHDGKNITGVTMTELYLVNSDKGIKPNFIENITEGSLMATFHIEDNELWEEIKNGDMLNGFSLEGIFTIEKLNNNIIKNNKMNKIAKFIKSLMKFGEITTDKGKLYWEGEGDLVIDTEVYIDGENDEKLIAENGEYKVEDKTIVVEDGKVIEIKEPTTIDSEFNKFNKIRTAFEETYNEKIEKINTALLEKHDYFYIIEAGDEHVIISVWNDELQEEELYHYTISWDEEGNVILGESKEVEQTYVPVEEEKVEETVELEEEIKVEEPVIEENELDNLKLQITELKEEINALRKIVDEIIEKPASEPIVEEFKSVKENKLNKRTKLFSYLNN